MKQRKTETVKENKILGRFRKKQKSVRNKFAFYALHFNQFAVGIFCDIGGDSEDSKIIEYIILVGLGAICINSIIYSTLTAKQYKKKTYTHIISH